MGYSMTETKPGPELIALQGQLAGVIAALNMHVKRSEELAAEMEQLQVEISDILPEAPP
jgi:hypothetical protein